MSPHHWRPYYAQRASAGLIIAEATQISPQGKGYAWTPGIYDQAQVAGWKKITDAVHAKGGRIFLQLWHVGRISHPDLQPGNALPVALGRQARRQCLHRKRLQALRRTRAGTSELPALVEQYKTAAQLSMQAGFDGVEIHAANGYLLDQFLRDKTNQRTDAYGGSIETAPACCWKWWPRDSVVPSERVGIRLSPISPANDIADSDPKALFSYVVQQLNRYKLVYLHVVEGATGGPREVAGGFDLQVLRDLFQGIYIANNGYDLEMAAKARQGNLADLVAFGRPFIANPDLVERFRPVPRWPTSTRPRSMVAAPKAIRTIRRCKRPDAASLTKADQG
jgi:N-ethylmaleimide reductase